MRLKRNGVETLTKKIEFIYQPNNDKEINQEQVKQIKEMIVGFLVERAIKQ